MSVIVRVSYLLFLLIVYITLSLTIFRNWKILLLLLVELVLLLRLTRSCLLLFRLFTSLMFNLKTIEIYSMMLSFQFPELIRWLRSFTGIILANIILDIDLSLQRFEFVGWSKAVLPALFWGHCRNNWTGPDRTRPIICVTRFANAGSVNGAALCTGVLDDFIKSNSWMFNVFTITFFKVHCSNVFFCNACYRAHQLYYVYYVLHYSLLRCSGVIWGRLI